MEMKLIRRCGCETLRPNPETVSRTVDSIEINCLSELTLVTLFLGGMAEEGHEHELPGLEEGMGSTLFTGWTEEQRAE